MELIIPQIITIIVGSVAIIVYKLEQKNRKKQAAVAILFELKNAESLVRQAKTNISTNSPTEKLSENLYLMNYESWSKSRHLFVKDFEESEWTKISNYYNTCLLFDRAVNHQHSIFQANEDKIRSERIRVWADIVYSYEDQDHKIKKELQEYCEKRFWSFENAFMKNIDILFYAPMKPVNDAQKYLNSDDLLPISDTIIGAKLRKIAKLK